MRALTIALAGNPNSGKTTVFNAYTGAHQHVGNYPGITVEQKEGTTRLPDGELVRLIDLPGIYSLTAYTQEETVARMVLAQQRPQAIINVLNAAALERNLYLTVQFLEMGLPVALGLNMMDEANRDGVRIDAQALGDRLGLPVVKTIARSGEGLPALLEAAVQLGHTPVANLPLRISYGPDLDEALDCMEQCIIGSGFTLEAWPARWLALKVLEGDTDMLAHVHKGCPDLAACLEQTSSQVSRHVESTLGASPESLIADYRYGFIAALLRDGVLTRLPCPHNRRAFTDKADKVLTHRVFGPMILLAILYSIYTVTFTLGEVPMGWVENGFAWLRELVDVHMPDNALKSMILSGIIDGVGGVMGFVPLIILIFLQIAVLEDSGYMARMAYMLDRVFRLFGLHGCSVMPFIVGGGIAGGCAVPAVLASRTLRSPKEKLATILTVPFMACGAKLPVFLLFSGIFFPGHEAAVMFGLTLTGWCVALFTAWLLRATVIRGTSTPFVMELPPYRWPTLRGVAIHTSERTWEYLKKAGTIILAISILFWAAMTYPRLPDADLALIDAQINAATGESQIALEQERAARVLRYTVAGRFGQALEPLTLPAGFDWRTDVALIGGFAAKEVIVATLGTAYSLGDLDAENPTPLVEQIRADGHWTPGSALALLVFVLLYAPCLVTLAAIRQETGSWGWPLFSLVFNTLLAYGLAVLVRQLVG